MVQTNPGPSNRSISKSITKRTRRSSNKILFIFAKNILHKIRSNEFTSPDLFLFDLAINNIRIIFLPFKKQRGTIHGLNISCSIIINHLVAESQSWIINAKLIPLDFDVIIPLDNWLACQNCCFYSFWLEIGWQEDKTLFHWIKCFY